MAVSSHAAAAAGPAHLPAGTTGTYPHMQLVLAALGVLLTQAQAYLRGPLASGLAGAAQQLAQAAQQQGVNVAEVSEEQQQAAGDGPKGL